MARATLREAARHNLIDFGVKSEEEIYTRDTARDS